MEEHKENEVLVCGVAKSIIDAITGGDVAKAAEHLQGIDIKTPLTEQGSTALMIASAHGVDAVVQHIIEKYPTSVQYANSNGATALMFAINASQTSIVQALLKAGSDVGHTLNSGDSALNVAAGVGDVDIVQLLLQVDGSIDVNVANEDGRTALHTACAEGHEDVAQILLAAGAICNTSDCCGSTPLLDACRYGHSTIVHHLLKNGADTRLVSDRIICIEYSNMNTQPTVKQKIVNMLRAREWVPVYDMKYFCEKDDAEGFMALVRSQHLSAQEIATPLAGGGATALMLACLHGSKNVVRYLLETKLASVKERTSNGREPLSYAAWNGHIDVIRILVEYGASINVLSASGDAPITYACINGHAEAVDILLQVGASSDHIPLEVPHESVLEVLRKRGVR